MKVSENARMYSRRQLLRAWTRILLPGALLVGGIGSITWWLLAETPEADGAGVATVLALPTAILSLIAGVVSAIAAVRSIPRIDDSTEITAGARRLLQKVATNEAASLARLLGDSGRARPANMEFMQDETSSLRWRSDGGNAQGTLDDVAEFYNSLDLGRLVVVGRAGAGKTVLVLRLLLELALAAKVALDAAGSKPVPVPIKLSLASFPSPTEPMSVSDFRAAVDRWIVEQLGRNYGIEPALGIALVSGGWILPILDGLDEMDADDAFPWRARDMLIGLNYPVGSAPGPMVLTCREDRYRQLAAVDENREVGAVNAVAAQDATVVVIQPLDPEQIVGWLTHRFPESASNGGLQRRWKRVASTVQRHPNGRLAACLSSPLNLFLACSVYADVDTTPSLLCDLDQSSLESHLLEHLVPALTRHHPRQDGLHYAPGDVTRWLRTLADHLKLMADIGFSGVDYHFFQLWRTVHPNAGWRLRWKAAFVSLVSTIILSAVLLLAVIGILMASPPLDPSEASEPDDERGLLVPPVLILMVMFAVWLRPRMGRSPRRRVKKSPLRTRRGRRLFIRNVVYGLMVGTLVTLSIGLLVSIIMWIAGGLSDGAGKKLLVVLAVAGTAGVSLGLPIGLVDALLNDSRYISENVARPSEIFWRSLAGDAVFGAVFGVSVGALFGAVFGLAYPLWTAILVGLVFVCVMSLGGGLLGGGSYPWLFRYLLAVRKLRRKGLLPKHFNQWLDWAYETGLLRLSGDATQFRHRGLQAYFGSGPVGLGGHAR